MAAQYVRQIADLHLLKHYFVINYSLLPLTLIMNSTTGTHIYNTNVKGW